MTSGDWKEKLREWIAGGRLKELIPEVYALKGVQQPCDYHPEGDAFDHSLLAVESISNNDDERVFWAVLLHDIGKSTTTEFHNGRWRAHGHDIAGAAMAPTVLKRVGMDAHIVDVCWLIKNHQFEMSWQLTPGQPLSNRQKAFTRHELFPLLQKVCAADRAGRKPFSR